MSSCLRTSDDLNAEADLDAEIMMDTDLMDNIPADMGELSSCNVGDKICSDDLLLVCNSSSEWEESSCEAGLMCRTEENEAGCFETAECGDGYLDENEECDDGNTENEVCYPFELNCEFCDSSCRIEQFSYGFCGDGIVNHPNEVCDGGNDCMANCQFAPCHELEGGCPDLQWVTLEAGQVLMGSEEGEANELPVKQIDIATFDLMKSEITIALYRQCIEATICELPEFNGNFCLWTSFPEDKENYPMNCLSWHNVLQFATWVGARLPTESEWEYAAKGQGNQQSYPWGNEMISCAFVGFEGCVGYPQAVCSKPSGHTPQGICDMAGSVEEWVMDQYYPTLDRKSLDGKGDCYIDCPSNIHHPYYVHYNDEDQVLGKLGRIARSVRGGNWLDTPEDLSTSARSGFGSSANNQNTGGRLARSGECGDGAIQIGESCDDGNLRTESCNADQPNCLVCNEQCELVIGQQGTCGDGYVNQGEMCDGEDFCTFDCQWAPCMNAENGCPNLHYVPIEGGRFRIGYDGNPVSAPSHEVTVPSFKIMRSELTLAMYQPCVDSGWCMPILEQRDIPVALTWQQAMVYAAWVGARLPSEAEWEYTATSQGKDILYPWGNVTPSCSTANISVRNSSGDVQYCNNRNIEPSCRRSGESEQGVCGLVGNLQELVVDEWYMNYEGAPTDGSGRCSETCPRNANDYNPELLVRRVLRGGGVFQYSNESRVTLREASRSDGSYGIRLVKDQ